MKHLFYLLTLFIIVHTSIFSWRLSALSQNTQDKPDTKSLSKRYKVHFLSLKREHKIASSYFTLEGHNKLEVKIPGETFLDAEGSYTKKSLQFKASFEGTIIKQKKHYCYTFTITGISLLDTYIAGTIVLNESIKETHQVQEINFFFIGMPEESDTSDDKGRTLFPF